MSQQTNRKPSFVKSMRPFNEQSDRTQGCSQRQTRSIQKCASELQRQSDARPPVALNLL